MSDKSIKVIVTFERRNDGGLRVWSEDVPGLVLSHTDVDGVLEDVVRALETLLEERLGRPVEVRPSVGMREALEDHGIVDRNTSFVPGHREYAAFVH